MDDFSQKAIDLAATHAAEFVRLLGRQEVERTDLLRRHWKETRDLAVERAAAEQKDHAGYSDADARALAFLNSLFAGRTAPTFVGRAPAPPADAPPGVPVPLTDDAQRFAAEAQDLP